MGFDLDLPGLGQGQVAGCCECGNELSAPVVIYFYGEYIKANEISEA
jgi:hypothetical protein